MVSQADLEPCIRILHAKTPPGHMHDFEKGDRVRIHTVPKFYDFFVFDRTALDDGLSQAAAEAPVDHLVDTGLYAAAVPCVKGPPTAYARPDGPSMCSARTGAGGT